MKGLVIKGSSNAERQYGMKSGDRVAEALQKRGWIIDTVDGGDLRRTLTKLQSNSPDIAIPIGFGPLSAEDGTFWTLAQAVGIPCAGPSPTAGCICTEKSLFNALVRGLFESHTNVTTPMEIKISAGMTEGDSYEAIKASGLSAPLIVKPVLGGSSSGLHLATSIEDAAASAVARTPVFGSMLVQQMIENAREFTVTTLDELSGTRFLPIIELNRQGTSIMGEDEKFGPDARKRHIVNPKMTSDLKRRLQETALRIHNAVGARGIQRIDVLVSDDNRIFILEANPVAGLLAESLAVDAAAAAGLSFEDLAERYALTALLPAVNGFKFQSFTNDSYEVLA